MNMIKKRVLIGCAALALASATLLAGAQERSVKDCKGQANEQECRQSKMAEFQAKHEAKLHDALKITAAQEPAWKTFTDSMRPPAPTAPPEKLSRADYEKLSAPERMEKHIAMQQKHLEHAQARLAALKTFYGVLTPEQQTTMNKEVARMEQHRQGGKGPWGRGGHWGDKSDQAPPPPAK